MNGKSVIKQSGNIYVPVERSFFLRPALECARDLLGKSLIHNNQDGLTAGMIVEVEAYIGPEDKASHAYEGKRTTRTEIQFGTGGYSYVYIIYGTNYCFNVVCNEVNKPEVVLIRALEPISGFRLMHQRRNVKGHIPDYDLCRGPGKLCKSMGITKSQYGADLCGNELWISDCKNIATSDIICSPRINIDYAEEYKSVPWRFYIKDNPCVSATNNSANRKK